MKTISVKAVKRSDFGKKAAKAVRREGMVPCVLCGNGETETFSVDPREIKPLIYTPNSYIVEFDIEGKKELAVLREAQFHPVREEILHLDFFRIADGKPVSIAIPVRLTGNAEGVKGRGPAPRSPRNPATTSVSKCWTPSQRRPTLFLRRPATATSPKSGTRAGRWCC